MTSKKNLENRQQLPIFYFKKSVLLPILKKKVNEKSFKSFNLDQNSPISGMHEFFSKKLTKNSLSTAFGPHKIRKIANKPKASVTLW